jgi:hypothetical protein
VIVVWDLGPSMGEEAYAKRLVEVEALVSVLERQYPALLKALGEFKDKATPLKTAIGATPATACKKGE